MEKIIITGAAGFLGKRLTRHFRDRYQVYGFTRKELDFTDREAVLRRLRELGPALVIHCGAISDVSACARNPELSERVNVDGVANMAEGSRAAGARMIFCSSDQVYYRRGTKEEEAAFKPSCETEVLEPVPLYGQQKLRAEDRCLEMQPDSVILRLTMLYGEPDDGERESGKGCFAWNLARSIREREPLSCFETCSRGITDVRELTACMERLREVPAGVYNFGSSTQGSDFETIRYVAEAFGAGELVRGKRADWKNLSMDTGKAQAAGIRFADTREALIRYLSEKGLKRR